MNFYQETPEDHQRERDTLEKKIQDAVHKNHSSLKEWLVKPVVVATITAVITTSITVPLTIFLTNLTNKSLEAVPTQAVAEKSAVSTEGTSNNSRQARRP